MNTTAKMSLMALTLCLGLSLPGHAQEFQRVHVFRADLVDIESYGTPPRFRLTGDVSAPGQIPVYTLVQTAGLTDDAQREIMRGCDNKLLKVFGPPRSSNSTTATALVVIEGEGERYETPDQYYKATVIFTKVERCFIYWQP